ncbi:MAG TPA: hypothetical protein VME69_06550 [Methylocella sp.]|nr:hypothetical protein [Methylocella sp.]
MKKKDIQGAVALAECASLAAQKLAAIDRAAGARDRQVEAARQTVRIVADGSNVSALIQLPGMNVQFQNGVMAVDIAATQPVAE